MTTDEIIQALTFFTSKLPREALSEVPEHREELIPHFLDSLDYIAENVKTLMDENSAYNLHTFALFFLAQFREPRAFPKIVRLLHGDSKEISFTLDDILTEYCDSMLRSTYNGDISLLKEVIENKAYYEFARNTALRAYVYIVQDGHIGRDEMIAYLRQVISGLNEDDVEGASAVADIISEDHILELLPEAKILYDRGLVNTFICGPYDSFINHVFDYTYYEDKKAPIDDVIAELETWASYRQEKPSKPKPVSPRPAPPVAETKAKKKIGRNDPCPCGSGKKYKKCCLPKGITFREETGGETEKEEEGEITALMKAFDDSGMNLRELYNDRKPYNLLTSYPGLDPAVKEGERKFAEFFSPEAIKIDIPVYKALHHRAIPLWIRRDYKQEDLKRIDLLLEAFALFTQTCARDNIDTFDAFDEKYMVHYHAIQWIIKLRDLLKEYKDVIPQEQYAMRRMVSQTLERMEPGFES